MSCEHNEISEINMTPFVDIILVILVIFMATATFVVQGKINITLPTSSTEAQKDKQKPITITIDKDANIYLNDIPTTKEDLGKTLLKDAKEASKNGVILRSDAKVSFEHVVDVIDICKANDINKFSIQTEVKSR
ncbi:MAG: biopolymer transporter ExbD [Sulfurimonas sp.]|nr:biopolymer transporter ExbD [Sulfurimonas sp.]MDD3834246.1 biopolymer transporter ExbD [Sulfurimonas sp.]